MEDSGLVSELPSSSLSSVCVLAPSPLLVGSLSPSSVRVGEVSASLNLVLQRFAMALRALGAAMMMAHIMPPRVFVASSSLRRRVHVAKASKRLGFTGRNPFREIYCDFNRAWPINRTVEEGVPREMHVRDVGCLSTQFGDGDSPRAVDHPRPEDAGVADGRLVKVDSSVSEAFTDGVPLQVGRLPIRKVTLEDAVGHCLPTDVGELGVRGLREVWEASCLLQAPEEPRWPHPAHGEVLQVGVLDDLQEALLPPDARQVDHRLVGVGHGLLF